VRYSIRTVRGVTVTVASADQQAPTKAKCDIVLNLPISAPPITDHW
jgi:hypothetical protein